jgi:hypothetical protein
MGRLNYSPRRSVGLTDSGAIRRASRRRRQWVKEIEWKVLVLINMAEDRYHWMSLL